MGIKGHAQCLNVWRRIQADHMAGRNSDRFPWADIAYSFGYCSHGAVFEGRGWNVRSAANGGTNANADYLAFCYIGGEGDPFTIEAQRALCWLSDECKRRGGRQRWPHSKFRATSCAGITIDRFIAGDMHAALTPSAKPIPIVYYKSQNYVDEGVDMIRIDYHDVMLGDGPGDTGKGWVWCDIDHDKIVSIKMRGNFPSVDGYGTVPTFASQARATEGHKSVIEIDKGAPGQIINFSVWALA